MTIASLLKSSSILVACCAFCLSAESIYLLSKAHLAQHLLINAWQQNIEQAQQTNTLAKHKPWDWADTYPVAKLTLQKNQESWVILAGMNGRTMAFGPGWKQDSAQPNHVGNTIIAGHNDSHFQALEDVDLGDILYLENQQGLNLAYQVEQIDITDQYDNQAYAMTDNTQLTLITCYPFTASQADKDQRYIVQAVAL
jgi:sortase A